MTAERKNRGRKPRNQGEGEDRGGTREGLERVRRLREIRERRRTAGLKGKAEGSWGSGQESYGPDQRKKEENGEGKERTLRGF